MSAFLYDTASLLTTWPYVTGLAVALAAGVGGLLWRRRETVPAPAFLVLSFGTLHCGKAPEADIVEDIGDLFRDPHVDPAFRQLTGRDQKVVDKVMSTEGVPEFIEDLYQRAVRRKVTDRLETVTVAVACRGGRHRSVVIADQLGELLREAGWTVEVEHLHVDRPVVQREVRDV